MPMLQAMACFYKPVYYNKPTTSNSQAVFEGKSGSRMEKNNLVMKGIDQAGLIDLKGLLPHELSRLVGRMGQQEYRAGQLAAWIYGKGATDLDEMTDLSKSFREALKKLAWVSNLREVERRESPTDRTVKFLFELPTGECIESVMIEEGDRRTACLSSQVGCALDCRFCATGRMGFIRNLSPGQIIDQLIRLNLALRKRGERVTNVVMMGMGEPLLNYENLVRALHLMRLDPGPGIGGRKITVSTAGYLPGIRKLAREALNVGLAISLNATTDSGRERLMPITRRYKIADLLDAAREFYELRGRRVTFEYVLLDGLNDGDEDAMRLAALTVGLPCKINLIPYNELDGDIPYRRPPKHRITRFQQLLRERSSASITVRESRGRDISAACGQLYQAPRRKRIAPKGR